MDFYIQMGHGMQGLCMELSEYWGGVTAILSPLNMQPNKVKPFSNSLRKKGGRVLFDPQMYSPRKYQKNLQKYDYFPKENITTVEMGDCTDIISELAHINDEIESEAFILPSQTIYKFDERWNKLQVTIAHQGRQFANGRKTYHTISLAGEAIMDEKQIESIVLSASQWDVDGTYIVCEHPARNYLVDNPIWITNLLSLVAGIKRCGKEVIVGYASHQLLCLSLAKCDAIAAGSFLNLRWFKPERFETIDDNEPSRRATWYYCPQVFSEYKLTYLDVAKRVELLSRMAPPPSMTNKYSSMLFQGALPTSTNYKEADSFRHYLHCLRIQCIDATKDSYKETYDSFALMYETASSLFTGLRNAKIKGQDRDFFEIIDAIQAAVSLFNREFGFAMAQEWSR